MLVVHCGLKMCTEESSRCIMAKQVCGVCSPALDLPVAWLSNLWFEHILWQRTWNPVST